MAFAKTEVYSIDRRTLMKITGSMGIAVGFLPSELYAAGVCEKLVTENGSVKATQSGDTLQFWIDGLHLGVLDNPKDAQGKLKSASERKFVGSSDLKSRANITLFMDLPQAAVTHVESVVLLDSNKKLLGARYFDASMKMLDGRVPYVRFENVELDHKKDYYCVYCVRSGSNTKLYTSTISKPEASQLNTTWLPQTMRNDFGAFLTAKAGGYNQTPGLITTQFQFYTLNALEAHTARGRVTEMSSDGKSFKVNIDFMHGDINPDHFMRYFIVMDPVGRLLGVHKRSGKGDGGQTSGSLDVKAITRMKDAAGNYVAGSQEETMGIPPLQIANIADCPYIQFYTEDSYDAIARNMIRLR